MVKKPDSFTNNVLLIDDNDIDNFINERMVRGCRFAEVVYVNTSTRSGIEFLRNLATNSAIGLEHYPTVIFLDINMPILDGFQFLEELEKYDAEFVKNLKVVMLTSSINPEDEEKARKSKLVADFLHKPLTEDALDKLTKNLVS